MVRAKTKPIPHDFLRELLSLLRDENVEIVRYAARALASYPSEEVRIGLLDHLALCPEESIPELVDSLVALHCGEEEQRALLDSLMASPRPRVRLEVLRLLGRCLKAADGEGILTVLGGEEDPHCRAALLGILRDIGPSGVGLEAVQYCLADEDSRVRANAVEALGAMAPAEQLEDLLNGTLDDPSPRVRASAICLLWSRRPDVLWERLEADLVAEDPETELTAVYVLGRLGDERRASAVLLDKLRSPREEVRQMAVRGLLESRTVTPVESLVALYLEEKNERVRSGLLALCSRSDTRATLRAFGEVLLDPSAAPRDRATAARALGALGEALAVPILLRGARDEDARVRANSLEALGRCPGHGLVGVLSSFLADPVPRVQAAASLSMWHHGGADAMKRLLSMLRSTDPARQAAAAFALGEIGSAEVAAPLRGILKDLAEGVVLTEGQRRVQKQVMKALSKIQSPS